VAVVVAGCTSGSGEASTDPSRPTVAADGATEVSVTDEWTAQIPAEAAPAGTAILIDPASADTEQLWETDGVELLAAADIGLASGQPAAPVTFTYRLAQPLPADEVIFLVDDTSDTDAVLAAAGGDGDTAPSAAGVVPAQLNADRTVATVTVTHLSLKSWLKAKIRQVTDAVTNAVGRVFDQRSTSPDCPTPRPAWMTQDPDYLDNINAPLLVCVGGDPNSADTSVVKIVNNRGGVIVVTAPVTPAWAWQPLFGEPAVADWIGGLTSRLLQALAVPEAERSRSWVLFPGSQVHIGFTRDMVTGQNPLVVRGDMTPVGAAYGVMLSSVGLISALKDRNQTLAAAAGALSMAALIECVQSGSASADRADVAAVAEATLELIGCVIEEPQLIFELLEANVPAAVWRDLRDQITRTAAGVKSRGAPLLAIGQATFVLTDLITTLALGDAAWQVWLWAPLPARTPQITLGPGGTLGDLSLFADAEDALGVLTGELGQPDSDTDWTTPTLCGPLGRNGELWRLVRWGGLEVMLLDRPLPQPDGTLGGAPVQHLAGWTYAGVAGRVDPAAETADGLTLGSSRDEVVGVYGDQAQDVVPGASGGGSLGVFLGDFSNLIFDFDTDDRVAVMISGVACD
jgi:hypothetical protein